MSNYLISGQTGNGKGIVAAGVAFEYLRRGYPVASNVDFNLKPMVGPNNVKSSLTRLPDYPCAFDFDNLPKPHHTKDQSKNGALILDETALFLNSQDFRDKKIRPDLLRWFLLSRKKKWNVYLLIQDWQSFDKQILRSIVHFICEVQTSQHLSFPVPLPFKIILYPVLALIQLLMLLLRLPTYHIGIVHKCQNGKPHMYSETWFYRGRKYFPYYDTDQEFDPLVNSYDYNKDGGWSGWAGYCHIPPGRLNFGKIKQWNLDKIMRLTKIYLRSYHRFMLVGIGVLFCVTYFHFFPPVKYIETNSTSKVWAAIRDLAYIQKMQDKEIIKIYVPYKPQPEIMQAQIEECSSYVIVGDNKRCLKSIPRSVDSMS